MVTRSVRARQGMLGGELQGVRYRGCRVSSALQAPDAAQVPQPLSSTFTTCVLGLIHGVEVCSRWSYCWSKGGGQEGQTEQSVRRGHGTGRCERWGLLGAGREAGQQLGWAVRIMVPCAPKMDGSRIREVGYEVAAAKKRRRRSGSRRRRRRHLAHRLQQRLRSAQSPPLAIIDRSVAGRL